MSVPHPRYKTAGLQVADSDVHVTDRNDDGEFDGEEEGLKISCWPSISVTVTNLPSILVVLRTSSA